MPPFVSFLPHIPNIFPFALIVETTVGAAYAGTPVLLLSLRSLRPLPQYLNKYSLQRHVHKRAYCRFILILKAQWLSYHDVEHSEILRSAHRVCFMCFVWFPEQTEFISLHNIN